MSPSFQGVSGPSGSAGSLPAFGQLAVRGNYAALEPALTSLQQIPPEQPILREIKRLIVRLLIDPFDPRANKLPGGISTPLKHYWYNTRYDSVFLTNYSPNRPEGFICDKGTDRHFGQKFG